MFVFSVSDMTILALIDGVRASNTMHDYWLLYIQSDETPSIISMEHLSQYFEIEIDFSTKFRIIHISK